MINIKKKTIFIKLNAQTKLILPFFNRNRFVDAPRSEKALRERWNSREGKMYFEEVKSFITASIKSKSIDFSLMDIPEYGNITPLFPNYLNCVDLGGINLTDLENIQRCCIKNVNFESAVFSKMAFNTITFENVTLDNSDFRHCELFNITFSKNVTISSINIKGAEIFNWVGLTDENIKSPMKYSVPSYLNLLFKSIAVIIWLDFPFRKYTVFKETGVDKLEKWSNKEFKEYVKWHEHIMFKFEKFQEFKPLENWKKKPTFIFGIIFTRYWSSFTVLALWAILFNVLMAYKISLDATSFHFAFNDLSAEERLKHLDYAPLDFKTALYYCIITFTTLGYGDMYPQTHKGQFDAATIALVGYITLSMIIYLISRKVEKMF